MAETSSSPKKSNKEKDTTWFSTGVKVALQLWLLFLIGFFFSGTPVELSIVFGALGGCAGGILAAWLKQTEAPARVEKIEDQVEEEPLAPLIAARLKRQEKYKNKNQKKDRRPALLSRLLRRRSGSRQFRR